MVANLNENPTAIRLRYAATKPLAALLLRLKVRPTQLNLLGLIAGLVAAVVIAQGNFGLALLIFSISALSDGLDGVVARTLGVQSSFGTFFDSVCDRYVDTAVLLSIAWYFWEQTMPLNALLIFTAIVGTTVTSYSRARAESLSLSSRYIGFLNRPERVLLVIVGLAFPVTLGVISWILAIMSNLTAVHRVVFYSLQALGLERTEADTPNPSEKPL
jgi:phosphatidylinositol phosphate synthase